MVCLKLSGIISRIKTAAFSFRRPLYCKADVYSGGGFQSEKHAPLNLYVPLYADSEDSEGRNLADVLETIDEANPENLFISQEDREDFKRKVNETLSKMEQEVLSYYLQGFRYEQIAEAMGKEPKAVDNALQRLKKKLKGK